MILSRPQVKMAVSQSHHRRQKHNIPREKLTIDFEGVFLCKDRFLDSLIEMRLWLPHLMAFSLHPAEGYKYSLGKPATRSSLTTFNLAGISLSLQSQNFSVISSSSLCLKWRQPGSQFVKRTSLQKTEGTHCGEARKDWPHTPKAASLSATAEPKAGLWAMPSTYTAAACTRDTNTSAKAQQQHQVSVQLRIPLGHVPSYHRNSHGSNNPMCFQIFPEG